MEHAGQACIADGRGNVAKAQLVPSPDYITRRLALVLGKCLALGSHIFIYQVFCNHYFIFMFL